jgi:hypothetical protein
MFWEVLELTIHEFENNDYFSIEQIKRKAIYGIKAIY